MNLKTKALTGVFWNGTQQISGQLISFGVSIILARLLLPEEFGLVAMIGIVLAIGKTLVEAGMTTSLIRTPNITEADYSSVFYINLAVSVVMYLAVFFLAPAIALFYHEDILTPIIRVMALTFIISAFSQVQQTRLIKFMDFKALFWVNLPATIIGGGTGIIMAYRGYGVWSLVFYNLARALVTAVQLWVQSRWTPSIIFQKKLFFKHFNFGYKLTLSGLLNTLFDNLYPVVIGKFFSATQLGFFTRADSLKQLPVNNFASVFNNVAFPLLSEVQEDKPRFKATMQKIIKLSVFVIAPILFIMAALAKPLFSFLFTEKWDEAVPYFQILVISGVLYPIHMYNLTVLNVLGRSDLFLKLEIIKKIMIIAGIGIAWQWGVTGLLWSSVVVSATAWVVNTHYTKIFIHYSLFEQIKDVAPVLIYVGLASMTSLGLDMWMASLGWSNASRLFLAGSAGFIIYLSLAQMLRLSSYDEVRSILRTSLKKYLLSKSPQE